MRILVVEDEEDLARSLSEALREEGYAVDTARDGEEGAYKARSWDYDAVVLDVNLPGKSGYEVLAELRAQKRTPVLLLTARRSVGDRVRGLDAGADDYLAKPFELAELLARLRALIRRSSGQASPVIEIGEVSVDTAARTVRKRGVDVALTPREYSLLEILALRRGEVVSRTQLYEHLFDETDESLSNLVDVHISRLRKKLGRELVETRRGHGYLVPEDPGKSGDQPLLGGGDPP